MQSRNVRHPGSLIQISTDKIAKKTVTSYYRPNQGGENFSVITQVTNGDFKTVNPHHFTKIYWQEMVGRAIREDSYSISESVGVINTGPTWATPGPSSWDPLFNSALSDVYDKIRSGDVGSGLDLSVGLAEAGQTRKLFADSLRLLGKIPLELALAKRRGKALSSRDLASRWLEWQLAWRPLFGDVYNTFDALMHRRLYAFHRVTGKARDKERNFFSRTVGPYALSVTDVERNMKARLMIEALFQIPNTTRERLSGYTSLNPASIIWELTPYSFVVDWIIDIGGYLRALESAAMYSQRFVSGYAVQGYLDYQDGTTRENSNTGGVKTFVSGKSFRRATYKNRYKLTAQTVFPRTPRFNVNLGWQRLVTAASLLRLQLPKR